MIVRQIGTTPIKLDQTVFLAPQAGKLHRFGKDGKPAA